MNSEEKFKKDLSDLLASKEFPFDELEWKKTSAMLDAKKRKKRIAFILFTGILFILGGTAYFCFPTHTNTIAIVETKTEIDTEVIKSANIKTKETDSPVNKAVAKTKTKNTDSKKKSSQTNDTPKETSLVEVGNKIKESPVDKSVEVPIPVTSNPESLLPVDSSPGINESDETEKASSQIAKTTFAVNEEETKTVSTTPSTFEEKQVEKNESIVLTPSPETVITIKPEDKKYETSNTVADTINTNQNESLVIKTDSTTCLDSTLSEAVVAKPDTDYVKRKRPEITLEGGASYLLGWKTQQGRDARGFNAILGINYMQKLASDLKLGIGFQYSAVGHLKYSSYTSKVTRLDLGEVSQVTLFTPQKMHYVWMPIKIHYAINEKSVFGGGITLGYLLTIDSKVERFGQSIKGQTNYQQTKEKGYTQGFSEIDAQISVFYQHKLFGRFYGNGEFVYGIRDIKNGEILSSEGFERNLGFKFTLLYRLFNN